MAARDGAGRTVHGRRRRRWPAGRAPRHGGPPAAAQQGGSDGAEVRAGLPVQLHIADPDEYQSPAEIAAWEQTMTGAGATVKLFRYAGAGHLFTDPGTPGHDEQAAALAWGRSLRFLGSL